MYPVAVRITLPETSPPSAVARTTSTSGVLPKYRYASAAMPSNTITAIPPTMMLLAHGEPPDSAVTAARSIRRPSKSLCLVSIAIFVDHSTNLSSKRIQNILPCRVPCRRDASEQSHHDRKTDGRRNHRRRHLQTEYNLAE